MLKLTRRDRLAKIEVKASTLPGIGEYCVARTYNNDGWWSANVAGHSRVISVDGFSSEDSAITALTRVLAK